MREIDKTHASRVYKCFQGLLAVYHPDVEVAWFSKRYTRAEEAYRLFCETMVPHEQLLARLNLSQEKALLLLATAVRDRQQTDPADFLPHAQRYINELAKMTFTDFQASSSSGVDQSTLPLRSPVTKRFIAGESNDADGSALSNNTKLLDTADDEKLHGLGRASQHSAVNK